MWGLWKYWNKVGKLRKTLTTGIKKDWDINNVETEISLMSNKVDIIDKEREKN